MKVTCGLWKSLEQYGDSVFDVKVVFLVSLLCKFTLATLYFHA